MKSATSIAETVIPAVGGGDPWRSAVEQWYLDAWSAIASRDGHPKPHQPEVDEVSKLIAVHLARDGAQLERLIQLDAGVWAHVVSCIQSAAPTTRRSVVEQAIEALMLSVMTSRAPAQAGGSEPFSSEAIGPVPFTLACGLDDWARVLAIRASVDDELRQSGRLDSTSVRLIQRRGRPVAVSLLSRIAALPRLQRLALTLAVWRSDRMRVKEILLDLTREALPDRPVGDLFPLPLQQSIDSDRELAAYLSHEFQAVKPGNVAANRSVARRKLVDEDASYAALLSAMLPYRKPRQPADAEQSPRTSGSDEEQVLATALMSAVDTGGTRVFELLVQATCDRNEQLLPAYRRWMGATPFSEPISASGSPWVTVHAHVVSCNRCRTIVHELRLPSEERQAGGTSPFDEQLDERVERLAVDALRNPTLDESVRRRLIAGLEAQLVLRDETEAALTELKQSDDPLSQRAAAALERQRLVRPPQPDPERRNDAKALPIQLEASPTHSSRPQILLSGPAGITGRLTLHEPDEIRLHLVGLPKVLENDPLRLLARYHGEPAEEVAIAATFEERVRRGSFTTTCEELRDRPLRDLARLTIYRRGGRRHAKEAGYRLAAMSSEARDRGELLRALSLSRQELALRASLPPTHHAAEAARRAGQICLDLGRIAEAFAHLQRAYELAERERGRRRPEDDRPEGWERVRCDAMRGLGEVAAAQADWTSAETWFGEALALATRLGQDNRVSRPEHDKRIATILTAEAQFHLVQGRLDRLRVLLEQADRRFAKHRDVVGRAATLNVRALDARARSNYDDAIAYCSEARRLLDGEERTTRVRRLLAELDCTEGRVKHALGDSYEAIKDFRRSLDRNYEIGHRRGEGDAMSAIGRVHRALGDADAAIRHFQCAIEIFASIPYEPGLAAVLGMLARARLAVAVRSSGSYRQNLLKLALRDVERSVRLRRTAWGRAITLTVRASIFAELSRDDPSFAERARGDYEEAIELREQCQDERGLALTRTEFAEFELEHDPERAQVLAEAACAYFADHPSPRAETDARVVLAGAHERLGAIDEAVTQRARAVTLIEDVRAQINHFELRRHYIAAAAPHYRTLTLQCAAQNPELALVLTDATRGRVLLEGLRKPRPGKLDLSSRGPWHEGIAAVRDPRVAALSYVITDRGSLVFVVYEGVVRSVAIKARPDHVKSLTRALLAAVAEGSVHYPHGRRLYDYLIAPAVAHIDARVSHLVISPDEAIADLPFELLLTDAPPQRVRSGEVGFDWGASMPYLLRRFTITTTPALSLLATGSSRRAPGSARAAIAPALAEPSPGGADASVDGATAAREPLPSSLRHMDRRLLGDRATVAAAHALIDDPTIGQVLVIADSLQEQDGWPVPTPSGLVLANGEPWTIDEIATGRSSAALVVLCADGAANRPFDAGEVGRSVTWGFLRAGVREICASLVPVGSATDLVPSLFRRIEGGAAPIDALRAAQLELASAGQHPIDWGGWRHVTTAVPVPPIGS